MVLVSYVSILMISLSRRDDFVISDRERLHPRSQDRLMGPIVINVMEVMDISCTSDALITITRWDIARDLASHAEAWGGRLQVGGKQMIVVVATSERSPEDLPPAICAFFGQGEGKKIGVVHVESSSAPGHARNDAARRTVRVLARILADAGLTTLHLFFPLLCFGPR